MEKWINTELSDNYSEPFILSTPYEEIYFEHSTNCDTVSEAGGRRLMIGMAITLA
jgi:hypothetical protein